jgi:transcriptional regulator with XRE-family HTH domain
MAPVTDPRPLRELVAELRKARGFSTQKDLATAALERGYQLSASMIGHIEAGRRLPSRENIDALADLLDLDDDQVATLVQAKSAERPQRTPDGRLDVIEREQREQRAILEEILRRLPEADG